ncbi:hypothetical protein [Comamonas endophytica]|uniref:Uncharacterized protein n=1 Tax=Comamonas endophytica TaxID=2949090 RepID=A0ABY6GF79_9BURK|nr:MULTISPECIES: hypothetical protein [unclassified Acidovorax]MCD2514374.1 hypothetical protein [Acidovorax sp. D4N7]UYG53616.1 hypothetical protein M9799_19875 [Acidovorax sp. 5MLIR]UYG53664.1 hypothetical protein M9799_17140 [Acidovorax sp. 5MLIR]
MKYRLLEVASATQPLHLHLPEDISAFEDLRRDGLVAGTLLAPADAVIHSLTPDGHALLALRRCRLARQPGGSLGN